MSPSHQWSGPTWTYCRPPPGFGRGAEREVECEDAHRRHHLAVVGLGRHARWRRRGRECRRRSGANRRPCVRTRPPSPIEPPTPTTEITWVALPTDWREPRRELGVADRRRREVQHPRKEQNQQPAHPPMLGGDRLLFEQATQPCRPFPLFRGGGVGRVTAVEEQAGDSARFVANRTAADHRDAVAGSV